MTPKEIIKRDVKLIAGAVSDNITLNMVDIQKMHKSQMTRAALSYMESKSPEDEEEYKKNKIKHDLIEELIHKSATISRNFIYKETDSLLGHLDKE